MEYMATACSHTHRLKAMLDDFTWFSNKPAPWAPPASTDAPLRKDP
jgi:hypothetical protein